MSQDRPANLDPNRGAHEVCAARSRITDCVNLISEVSVSEENGNSGVALEQVRLLLRKRVEHFLLLAEKGRRLGITELMIDEVLFGAHGDRLRDLYRARAIASMTDDEFEEKRRTLDALVSSHGRKTKKTTRG